MPLLCRRASAEKPYGGPSYSAATGHHHYGAAHDNKADQRKDPRPTFSRPPLCFGGINVNSEVGRKHHDDNADIGAEKAEGTYQ
jgi:hypothetical protein